MLSIQQREPVHAANRVDQPSCGVYHAMIMQGVHDPVISGPPLMVNPNEPLIHVDKGEEFDRLF